MLIGQGLRLINFLNEESCYITLDSSSESRDKKKQSIIDLEKTEHSRITESVVLISSISFSDFPGADFFVRVHHYQSKNSLRLQLFPLNIPKFVIFLSFFFFSRNTYSICKIKEDYISSETEYGIDTKFNQLFSSCINA